MRGGPPFSSSSQLRLRRISGGLNMIGQAPGGEKAHGARPSICVNPKEGLLSTGSYRWPALAWSLSAWVICCSGTRGTRHPWDTGSTRGKRAVKGASTTWRLLRPRRGRRWRTRRKIPPAGAPAIVTLDMGASAATAATTAPTATKAVIAVTVTGAATSFSNENARALLGKAGPGLFVAG